MSVNRELLLQCLDELYDKGIIDWLERENLGTRVGTMLLQAEKLEEINWSRVSKSSVVVVTGPVN